MVIPSTPPPHTTICDADAETFGRWTVLHRDGARALCRCACGTEKLVLYGNLTSGKTKSCGCSRVKFTPGSVVGDWTVLEPRPPRYLCRCSCGVEREVLTHSLGVSSFSCGHKAAPSQNIVGRRYGELVVQAVERRADHRLYATCLCDCGATVSVSKSNLKRQTSCGHWVRSRLDDLREAFPTVEVETLKKLRQVWFTMLRRCYWPEDQRWDRYGGRGITVNDEWRKLPAFVAWSLSNGYDHGLSIDRIDNDGPYSPDNCRWLDDYGQARNKSTNVWVTAFGECRILADWVGDPRCLVRSSALQKRIADGWPHQEAVSLPPRSRRPST